MKEYKIKKTVYDKQHYSMIIIERETGEQLAEYRLTPGKERSEIAQMRRSIDTHSAKTGSQLSNYQW